MRPVIIGTAGHIDHGKSALIQALTGTDPDRLVEEKQRGMTIDIGFAFLTESIAFIDVPGHEKFIKNMVTGASTITTALLVVAADDGIMPQTREHLDILKLLKIPDGLIVITKIDTVSADWINLVEEEIHELVQDSFLENSPILRVSSVRGTGIEQLKKYLLKLPENRPAEDVAATLFRLPVDRVFAVKGHGTVVTGSVVSGRLRIGDELELLPNGKRVKVRGIQSHNLPVKEISKGHRAAINMQGIEYRVLKRGDLLVTPGYFRTSKLLSCSITLLQSARAVQYNSRIRVHIGTAEVLARIRFIGRDSLKPGDTAIAQLVFDEPIAVGFGDRLIIRQYSPLVTIGGGVVLEIQAKSLRKKDIESAEMLARRLGRELPELVQNKLEYHPLALFSEHDLAVMFTDHDSRIRQVLNDLKDSGVIVQIEKRYNTMVAHADLKKSILEQIRQFHRRKPLSAGMARVEIFERIQVPLALGNYLIGQLSTAGKLKIIGDKAALADFRLEFSEKQQQFINQLDATLREAEFNPIDLRGIQGQSTLKDQDLQLILAYLLDEGRIVQIDRDKFLHHDVVEKGAAKIHRFLIEKQSATVSELKEVLNTSRKWAVPLLNYYDRAGLTNRIGDRRELNQSQSDPIVP
jgi:selenocysteine-specific elongation factor